MTAENLDGLLQVAVLYSPVFRSRFRHNAMRPLMVLRQTKQRRTPVGRSTFVLQSLISPRLT